MPVKRKRGDESILIHGKETRVAELTTQAAECLAAFPTKQFDLIIADPPWRYRDSSASINGQTPYPTLSIKEISELPVPNIAKKTCILLLWATGPKFEEALQVVNAWGFKYKTVYKTWRKVTAKGKPVCGCGWWTRPNTEYLLLATKGSGATKWQSNRSEPQEFTSEKTAHSKKPEQVMEDIRRHLVCEDRVELFCRGQPSEGFAGWGLETPGYYAEA